MKSFAIPITIGIIAIVMIWAVFLHNGVSFTGNFAKGSSQNKASHQNWQKVGKVIVKRGDVVTIKANKPV